MQRRDFFGLAALPFVGAAAAAAPVDWALAYRNATGDVAAKAAVTHGRFPQAVHGVLFRNGPAIHEMGGRRYDHWFDGDGMVQRYAIGPAGVSHTGKLVQTAKYQAEMAAGMRLYEAFGSKWPGVRHVSGGDGFNVANTNVLQVNGELLALWEGGSAYSIDPATLQTRGVKNWSNETKGAPFSAHPHVEPDGTVWNFGVSAVENALVLYEIGADGKLRRAGAVDTPYTVYMHDFAVTERHLVFLLPPLVLDRDLLKAGRSFIDSHVWQPERGTKVLVVDKADWSKRTWLDLPAGFMFHLANAWDDGPGVIRVDYIHAAEPQVIFGTNRDLMYGKLAARPTYHIAMARLDLARRSASQELLAMQAEFPRIDPRLVGRRHGTLLHATQTTPRHPGFSAVALTSVETGRSEMFSYGLDHMAEEHVFVPETGAAPGGAGWVLGTALDLKRGRTVLSCLRAGRLADGPVAQAVLPYALPLGLHATFVPA